MVRAENPEPASAHRLLRIQRPLESVREVAPGARSAQIGDCLRAIRIVHVKNGSLREDIASAQARRMVRIAFNLGRASFVALHQDRSRISAKRHSAGEKERDAQDDIVRLPHIGDDGLQRAASRSPTVRPAPSKRSSASGSRDATRLPARPKPAAETRGAASRRSPRSAPALPGSASTAGRSWRALASRDFRQLQLAGTNRFRLVWLSFSIRLVGSGKTTFPVPQPARPGYRWQVLQLVMSCPCERCSGSSTPCPAQSGR